MSKKYFITFDQHKLSTDKRAEYQSVIENELWECDGPTFYDNYEDADRALTDWVNSNHEYYFAEHYENGFELCIKTVNIKN